VQQHPDSDDLALLALGESLGDPTETHVANCDFCQREVQSFRQTIGLAELSNYGEDAPPVSEHVWSAITAELGLAGEVTGDTITARRSGPLPAQPVPTDDRTNRFTPVGLTPTSSDVRSPTADHEPADLPDELPPAVPLLRAVPEPTEPAEDPNVTPRVPTAPTSPAESPVTVGPPARRWSRWVAPLAAAVVGIALGAGAVAVLNRSATDPVEAVAPLTPVPTGPLADQDGQQLGQADLVASPTGPQVRVTAADLPGANTTAYEVWLFGGDGKMVSLGTLSDGNGSFTVPPGIDPQEYRVVDISDEPPDGNPAHSGVSLVRGEFS
jgi:anti-sigma-K factor RskA